MSLSETEKLRVLLPHWIEHNREHAAEFREWRERIGQSGGEGIAAQLESATQSLEEACKALSLALEKLGGPPGTHSLVHN